MTNHKRRMALQKKVQEDREWLKKEICRLEGRIREELKTGSAQSAQSAWTASMLQRDLLEERMRLSKLGAGQGGRER